MRIQKVFICLIVLTAAFGCGKDDSTTPINPPGSKYKLSYGDSIIFLKNQAGAYIVSPKESGINGTFTGFPEGIEIDPTTGAINVSASETGLRYKITYTDKTTGDTSTAIVVISGINYYDKIYSLEANDTVAVPLYNATPTREIPSNSVFDEGNGCNGVGVAVDINSAKINLIQSIRNGVFGGVPKNGERKEVELKYRVNDGSGKTLNSLKVKLYYYNTSADIDADLIQLLKDREGTVFGANPLNGLGTEVISGTPTQTVTKAVAKPRPPCIFIVGRI
jgi:hypothetical protein